MTNAIETISNIVMTLADNEPKPPMNVGEVMHLWKYVALIREAAILEQIGLNTTTNVELTELLNEALAMCNSQTDHIKKVMKEEGIPLPASPEDKPKSEPDAIPLGAKLTDNELANIISAKLLVVVMECARNMTESVRFDIGALWAQFFYEHAKYGGKLKSKMRALGWLKIPPAYVPPGLPAQ